jgi:hypothetical protein
MNKLAFLAFFAVVPTMFTQSLKTEDFNIFVSAPISRLYSESVSDFGKMDLANMRALQALDGKWQELKKGSGESRFRDGGLTGTTSVWLDWQRPLDDEHWVAAYGWLWVAGTSSSSEIVQVFELRNGKVYITQEIEADIHHGGKPVGAWFDSRKKLLTVKAVNYAPLEGRCCPSLMGVVTFRWDGKRLRAIRAKHVPLPQDN